MRKFFLALFLGLMPTFTLQAVDFFIEGKAAYFRPQSTRFRDIYSSGGIYGIEATCQMYKNLHAWASASSFHKSGTSIGGNTPTTITFIPLGLGIKLLYSISEAADIYFGGGALATYLHLKDDSPFVIRKSVNWGYGGIAKLGFFFTFTTHFFIDVFADYSFMSDIHFPSSELVVRKPADLSGLSMGGGAGFRF